ncbi:MAG: hypothetical protein P8Q52_10095 [Acidimicrobiales bacterium]|nr:hypothetical protein [Acidimicrobiales bacterium]
MQTTVVNRFITLVRWYSSGTGIAYGAAILAGLILTIADELQLAIVMFAAVLLVALPWKLSFQEHARVNLSSRQNRLAKQLAETHDRTTALKKQLADIELEADTAAQRTRADLLGALDYARSEWGMLLRAEREQFASQLREHSAPQ